jgi:hypothetical protein
VTVRKVSELIYGIGQWMERTQLKNPFQHSFYPFHPLTINATLENPRRVEQCNHRE